MNKENPLITIVTPSYNQGKYIEETIQSVLNQTYKNIEYIIIDGCSNDETEDILKKYREYKNIKIIIEKDNGQTEAINKGFKMAKGELIGWINSDDILKYDCVENIVEAYKLNQDATVFYGYIDFIDEQSNKCYTKKIGDLEYNYLLNVNPDINQQGSFYLAKRVKEINYLDEKINFTMDYDLWLRLLKNNNGVNLHKIVGEFRIQYQSKTMTNGNAIKFWKDIFNIRKEKHYNQCKRISRIQFRFIRWCIYAGLRRMGINLKFE